MRRSFATVVLRSAHRGDGVLSLAGRKAPVRYDLSVFEQRGVLTASGSVEGELGDLDDPPGDAVLRLANGREVAVRLSDADAHGAAIETTEPPADGDLG